LSEDEDDRPIERKFVFICVKPETREALTHLKMYGDTYNSVIQMLLNDHYNRVIEDRTAQNIDAFKKACEEEED